VLVRTYAGVGLGYADGLPHLARFYNPYGIAADAAGIVYVADTLNNAVRRIGRDGRVSTVAGDAGGGGFGNADGPGNTARFDGPKGIAAAPDGKTLYVTTSLGKIVRIGFTGTDPADPSHWTVSTLAGSNAYAYVNGTGDVARFVNPFGIVLDASGTTLFVGELGGHRIRKIQFKGGSPLSAVNWQVGFVAGSVSHTPGNANGQGAAASFSSPAHLALDRSGNLYVADASNHQIRRIANPTDPSGGIVSTFADSTGGYADGTGAGAMFSAPYGLAADGAGYLYVTDYSNNRVRRISPTGVVSTVAGTGGAGKTDGPGNGSTFNGPIGIAMDPSGNLYVVEYNNSDVRLIQRVLK
jgi:sugar lactone lactonase YvrE